MSLDDLRKRREELTGNTTNEQEVPTEVDELRQNRQKLKEPNKPRKAGR